MMTKTELCQLIVNEHPKGTPLVHSSQFTVAMEHLGLLLTEDEANYAKTRGGVIFCGDVSADKSGDIQCLSLRTLLSLLPD